MWSTARGTNAATKKRTSNQQSVSQVFSGAKRASTGQPGTYQSNDIGGHQDQDKPSAGQQAADNGLCRANPPAAAAQAKTAAPHMKDTTAAVLARTRRATATTRVQPATAAAAEDANSTDGSDLSPRSADGQDSDHSDHDAAAGTGSSATFKETEISHVCVLYACFSAVIEVGVSYYTLHRSELPLEIPAPCAFW
jgi:hypothetical protein